MADDFNEKAEKFVRGLGKMAEPNTRAQWQAVLIRLMRAPDGMLEAIAHNGRMFGVSWLGDVCEGLLKEKQAGRAYRDDSGMLILTQRPDSGGLLKNVII